MFLLFENTKNKYFQIKLMYLKYIFWIFESERSKNEVGNNIMVFFIRVNTIHPVLILVKTSNIEKTP